MTDPESIYGDSGTVVRMTPTGTGIILGNFAVGFNTTRDAFGTLFEAHDDVIAPKDLRMEPGDCRP